MIEMTITKVTLCACEHGAYLKGKLQAMLLAELNEIFEREKMGRGLTDPSGLIQFTITDGRGVENTGFIDVRKKPHYRDFEGRKHW